MTRIDSAAKTTAVLPSPDALLKAAVSGGKGIATGTETARVPEPVAPAGGQDRTGRRIDSRTMGVAGVALLLGALIGAGTAVLAVPKAEQGGTVLAEIHAGLESNRLEASRLAVASDRLGTVTAALKESVDAARNETKSQGAGLVDRIGKVDQVLAARIATLSDRIDHSDREQASRIAALAVQVDKRPAAGPAQAMTAKPEPVQTGSIGEAKPKPAVIEAWAVRDVYDGTAMLEDRRRRLLEVAVGDSIPGIGRVDAVERRGREWVVVTRQGVVTPQSW